MIETNCSRDGLRLKNDNWRRGCRLQDPLPVEVTNQSPSPQRETRKYMWPGLKAWPKYTASHGKYFCGDIIAFSFVLFHRDRFFSVCCLSRQQFSATCLLKLFLLPQRAHTILFIRFDKPKLTRSCLCSLHAGMKMSPLTM